MQALSSRNDNLILPTGTEKIGDREYLVGSNSSPPSIAELNEMPIRSLNGSITRMRDVAWIHDGYEPQTSFVRENGKPSVFLTVIKNGVFSTITVVNDIKKALPRIKAGLPSALTMIPLFDVVQEAITAALPRS